MFWLLLLCFALIVSVQLRLAGEQYNKVSIVNVTTVALVAFSVVGTLPLFYFLDEYRYNIGIQEPLLVLVVLFYSVVNIICFLVGVIFIRRVVGLKVVEFCSNEIGELFFAQK